MKTKPDRTRKPKKPEPPFCQASAIHWHTLTPRSLPRRGLHALVNGARYAGSRLGLAIDAICVTVIGVGCIVLFGVRVIRLWPLAKATIPPRVDRM
jgi:hypothetical protein